jgi:hypothetical protein
MGHSGCAMLGRPGVDEEIMVQSTATAHSNQAAHSHMHDHAGHVEALEADLDEPIARLERDLGEYQHLLQGREILQRCTTSWCVRSARATRTTCWAIRRGATATTATWLASAGTTADPDWHFDVLAS